MLFRSKKANDERAAAEERNSTERIRDAVELNDAALKYQGLEDGTLALLSQQLVFLDKQLGVIDKKHGLSKEEYELLQQKKDLEKEIRALQHPEIAAAKERSTAEASLKAQHMVAITLGEDFDYLGGKLDILKKQYESLDERNRRGETGQGIMGEMVSTNAAIQGKKASDE